jgi:hypothetical protein
MSHSERPESWWRTLPGVLTGIAAVITAVTGLAVAVLQSRPSGSDRERVASDTSTGIPIATDSVHSKDSGRGGWSNAQAVVTTRDGSITRLRAETFSNCISVGHSLTLDSGQDVPFERMRSFEVLNVDPRGAPNARARLRFTLVDGASLEGSVAADCDLFGYNDVGRYTTYYQDLERVDFVR